MSIIAILISAMMDEIPAMTIAEKKPASLSANEEITAKIRAKTEIPEKVIPIELNEDFLAAIISKFSTSYL